MYDDICLLSPMNASEIGQVKALYDWDGVNHNNYDVWYQQLIRTLTAVRRRGFHGWNTETHFSELFNKELMLCVIRMYGALENRLLTSTLFFNTFFPKVISQIFRKDYGIQFFNNKDTEYYTSSQGDLDAKCLGKLYLVFNDAGLNENLKRFLENKFPEKSRFEK